MKVKELIEQLQKMNPDAEAVCPDTGFHGEEAVPIESVEEIYWKRSTLEAISIDDVDVDSDFEKAVMLWPEGE